MTMANTLNYSSPGGDEWVVGGRLVIRDGAVVEGLPSSPAPVAGKVADSVAEDVAALRGDHNALLAALRSAGLMEE